MNPGKCRACGGPLMLMPISDPSARSVGVRLIVRAAGGRRMGDFDLCPRCTRVATSPEVATRVQAALLAELQALLR